jgi:hypothetical protein
MAFPYAWRVTKYNPALRNSHGHYLIDEWTFFAQIGTTFNGKALTYEEYLSVESAYSSSAHCFLNDAGLSFLRVSQLENHKVSCMEVGWLRDIVLKPSSLRNDLVVNDNDLEDVVRLNLREVLWCKLVETDRFYLHFGWDYYLYIGSTSPSLSAIKNATQKGLFVEEMISPYLHQYEDT